MPSGSSKFTMAPVGIGIAPSIPALAWFRVGAERRADDLGVIGADGRRQPGDVRLGGRRQLEARRRIARIEVELLETGRGEQLQESDALAVDPEGVPDVAAQPHEPPGTHLDAFVVHHGRDGPVKHQQGQVLPMVHVARGREAVPGLLLEDGQVTVPRHGQSAGPTLEPSRAR